MEGGQGQEVAEPPEGNSKSNYIVHSVCVCVYKCVCSCASIKTKFLYQSLNQAQTLRTDPSMLWSAQQRVFQVHSYD